MPYRQKNAADKKMLHFQKSAVIIKKINKCGFFTNDNKLFKFFINN